MQVPLCSAHVTWLVANDSKLTPSHQRLEALQVRTVRQIATGGLAQAGQVDDLLHEGNALLRVCLLAMLRSQMPVTGTRHVHCKTTNPAGRCELGMFRGDITS